VTCKDKSLTQDGGEHDCRLGRSTMISTVSFASARRARIQKQPTSITARTVISTFVSSVSLILAVNMGRWDVQM